MDEAGLPLCKSVTRGNGQRIILTVASIQFDFKFISCLASHMNGICYLSKLLQVHASLFLYEKRPRTLFEAADSAFY